MLKSKGEKYLHFHGRLDSINGVGVNILIKKGATMVTSPNDIINEFPEFQVLKNKMLNNNSLIKREYRKIYNILNDIPIRTQNTIKCTLRLLSLMEIEDLIDEIPGARLC